MAATGPAATSAATAAARASEQALLILLHTTHLQHLGLPVHFDAAKVLPQRRVLRAARDRKRRRRRVAAKGLRAWRRHGGEVEGVGTGAVQATCGTSHIGAARAARAACAACRARSASLLSRRKRVRTGGANWEAMSSAVRCPAMSRSSLSLSQRRRRRWPARSMARISASSCSLAADACACMPGVPQRVRGNAWACGPVPGTLPCAC